MALVVMCHGAAATGLERQPRLRAVERLDLALLVDRQHHRVGRRIEVEADDIGHLLGKPWIARALEAAYPVWLELVGIPDPLHRAQRDAGNLGHRPTRPVRDTNRRIATGQRHHTRHCPGQDRRLTGLARLVAQQPIWPLLGETLLPAPNHRATHGDFCGHASHRSALHRSKHCQGPFNILARLVAIRCDRLKPASVRRTQQHAYCLCHLHKFARRSPTVNQQNASVH